MQQTRIEWCDISWNPVTGCLYNCEYCYAKPLVRRFPGHFKNGYDPVLHEDRLQEIFNSTGIIFAGSFCDLFGTWVPEQWIARVVAHAHACVAAVVFLTKNPARYIELLDGSTYFGPAINFGERHWLGATLDKGFNGRAPDVEERINAMKRLNYPRKWISVEPFAPGQEEFYKRELKDINVQWAVLGFRTGMRFKHDKGELSSARGVVDTLQSQGIPVFVKNSIVEAGNKIGINPGSWPRNFPSGMALTSKSAAWKG